MIGYGLLRPLFSVLYGKVTGGATKVENDKERNTYEMPAIMASIGAIAGLAKFCQVACLELFADSISYKIRMNYFKSVLGKDSTWFDANNPNEIASKISTEIDMIQAGIGEKVGEIVHALMTFFVGFALAFYIGWEFSLILMGAFPVLAFSGIVLKKTATIG